jgi:hypothetical protein
MSQFPPASPTSPSERTAAPSQGSMAEHHAASPLPEPPQHPAPSRDDWLRRLARLEPLARLGESSNPTTRAVTSASLVAGSVLGAVVLLAVGVLAVAGAARGIVETASRTADVPTTPVASSTRGAVGAVTESMTILTGKMDHHPGWPRYTHAFWAVRAGEVVTLRITSYDDGTAPLTGAQMMYDRVSGTIGDVEEVDGRPVSSIPDEDVAHTFTVVGLGLNLVLPAAPPGRTVTVVARFVPRRTGVFLWQCYAPCGSGPNSMGGAMASPGYMEGRVTVRG